MLRGLRRPYGCGGISISPALHTVKHLRPDFKGLSAGMYKTVTNSLGRPDPNPMHFNDEKPSSEETGVRLSLKKTGERRHQFPDYFRMIVQLNGNHPRISVRRVVCHIREITIRRHQGALKILGFGNHKRVWRANREEIAKQKASCPSSRSACIISFGTHRSMKERNFTPQLPQNQQDPSHTQGKRPHQRELDLGIRQEPPHWHSEPPNIQGSKPRGFGSP